MNGETNNLVKSTRRSFRILEILFESGSARLTDIATAVDLPNSTVHNHLHTLIDCGFVVRDDDRYRISLRFLTFGETARRRYKISKVSRVELTDLAREADEAATIAVKEGGDGYVLAHEPVSDTLPLDLFPGKRLPLHATSFGKVLLADLPDEEITALAEQGGLPACTTETITTPTALLEELTNIRSQGYAISDEERLRGVRSLATAIRNEQGIAVGAVGISGPTSRLTSERLAGDLLQQVLNMKNVAELHLSHS